MTIDAWTTIDREGLVDEIRELRDRTQQLVDLTLPPPRAGASRELSLTVTNLEQAEMWASRIPALHPSEGHAQ